MKKEDLKLAKKKEKEIKLAESFLKSVELDNQILIGISLLSDKSRFRYLTTDVIGLSKDLQAKLSAEIEQSRKNLIRVTKADIKRLESELAEI